MTTEFSVILDSITPEAYKTIHQAIVRTFSEIEEPCEDNFEALELCLDAGRLVSLGGSSAAETLVEVLCARHGFESVVAALNTRIKLV